MKKPIAIAFSDLHLNMWAKHSNGNSRLMNGIDVIRVLTNKCNKLGVPLLFGGDLLHNPKSADSKVLMHFESAYKKIITPSKVVMYGIDGNHDQWASNTINNRVPGYFQTFSLNKKYMKCLNYTFQKVNGVTIAGIPYLKNNEGFNKIQKQLEKDIKRANGNNKKTILLIHTDLPGAKTPSGLELGEYMELNQNLDNQFEKWSLVLAGHIHLPQALTKKVIMMGSPQHQIVSDAGIDMGYWIIYSDFSYSFEKLSQYPQFKYYDEGDKPPDKINFWIPRPQVKEEDEVVDVFNAKMSRKKLAKRYCKATNQLEKSKVNFLTEILNSVE